jgi:hypothetical protein
VSDHHFTVGQHVSIHRIGGVSITPGVYKIVRLLPRERDDAQYRVQHTGDKHERVVTEAQISPVNT